MRSLRVWSSAVLAGYALILILLAYFFFSHEIRFVTARDHGLQEDFILRFSAFWFLSFLFTILVYLLNLSLNYLWLPRTEKVAALRVGKFILGVGLLSAALVIGIVSLFNL